VLVLLVDVHRAAEGQNGVVIARVGGRVAAFGDLPGVELGAARLELLGEDAGTGVVLVNDCKCLDGVSRLAG
jgi:hypothetical protein